MPAMAKPSPATPRVVIIRETLIELCQLLKFGGLAGSGGEAKQRISNGEVLVNGTLEPGSARSSRPATPSP